MALSVTHKGNTFSIGDTVRVYQKIKETTSKGAERTRLAGFEGIVISARGHGENKSFTVRRIGAANIGVERIFPVLSPLIEKVDVVNRGVVRRAKLYYLREKSAHEVADVSRRYSRLQRSRKALGKPASKKKTVKSKKKSE